MRATNRSSWTAVVTTAVVLAVGMVGWRWSLATGGETTGNAADPQAASAQAATVEAERSPQELARLLAQLDEMQSSLAATINRNPEDPAVSRLQAAIEQTKAEIDRVGGQLHCSASRFYWHTDLATAQAVAAEQGKPILSLRMLGKLTDDLSCANSRFFRTTLYANEAVLQYLRDNFVLHWQSVRPVPTVTVDFGDGRKLVRTVTGNSAHYVLTADGAVVDAIPGLYGPAAFLERLRPAVAAAERCMSTPEYQRAQFLRGYHQQALAEMNAAWQRDLQQLGMTSKAEPVPSALNYDPRVVAQQAARQGLVPPPAPKAAEIAVPKFRVEMPLIATIMPGVGEVNDDELWQRIATLHADSAELDAASVKLIATQNPTATEAANVAITKRIVESPLVRMLRNLRSSIALDTVRNEYQLHRQIHEWLAQNPTIVVNELNDRVYAELFLTPSSDPWLGLVPAATYTALQNGGLVSEPQR